MEITDELLWDQIMSRYLHKWPDNCGVVVSVSGTTIPIRRCQSASLRVGDRLTEAIRWRVGAKSWTSSVSGVEGASLEQHPLSSWWDQRLEKERLERWTFWMNDLVMRREELHLRSEREEKRGVHLSISWKINDQWGKICERAYLQLDWFIVLNRFLELLDPQFLNEWWVN